MNIMPRVVHFEISAEKPKRAVKFYRKVFGWEISPWEGPMEYWIVKTGDRREGGIDGAIMKRTIPGMMILNTISVPSLEEYSKKVEDAGGKMLTPRVPMAGIGYFAYFMDTEGNILGLMEEDKSAELV